MNIILVCTIDQCPSLGKQQSTSRHAVPPEHIFLAPSHLGTFIYKMYIIKKIWKT